MNVKVKRMTLADYNNLMQAWGHKAKLVTFHVPSTVDGIKFQGVFTDDTHKEIAVAWPVDRPDSAQSDYSNKYRCGYPVDEFELHETMNGGTH